MKLAKKLCCLVIFLIIAEITLSTVHAQHMGVFDTSIYIEGTATLQGHQSFFMENFTMEAISFGLNVVDSRILAEYTFRFDVEPFGPDQYIIRIDFFNNENNARILSLARIFTHLEESYEFNQILLFQAIVLIPRADERIIETVIEEVETIVEVEVEVEVIKMVEEPDDWRNKWLYIRASIDYPVSYFILQPDGLIGGMGVYDGNYNNPSRVSPIDNDIIALPGATLGLEVQILDWLSFEANVQLSFGRPGYYRLLNLAAAAELKFPLKMFGGFLISPYGTFVYPVINNATAYVEFPLFAVGGGIQIGVRGGTSGAFFVDLSYQHYLGDVIMHNTYGNLYPNPSQIHYRTFIVKLGIGYKFGFFNRNN